MRDMFKVQNADISFFDRDAFLQIIPGIAYEYLRISILLWCVLCNKVYFKFY